MRPIQLGATFVRPFSLSDAPDSLPTVKAYAGETYLGDATVAATASTTNRYTATYTLPGSGIALGINIFFRVDCVIDSVAQPTADLFAGYVAPGEIAHAADVPTAAQNRAEIDLNSTQLAAIVSTQSSHTTKLASIEVDTDRIPATPATESTAAAAKTAAEAVDAKLTTTRVEKLDLDLSTFDASADTVTVGANNDKTGYALTTEYDAAKTAAQADDVSPTINFSPTIEPTPVTVNPTVLSTASVNAIRDGLATGDDVTAAAQSVIDHGDGDGDWGATAAGGGSGGGTNGTGDYAITVNATESGLGVRGVRVSVVGTTTYDHTATNGAAVLNVDAGDYVLRITPPADFDAVADITANGIDDDTTVNVTLTRRTIAAATDPALCNVACDVVTQYGTRPDDATVWAVPTASLPATASALIVTDDETYTTTDGRAVLPLLRGEAYTIAVRYLGNTKTFAYTVPDAATAVATLNL